MITNKTHAKTSIHVLHVSFTISTKAKLYTKRKQLVKLQTNEPYSKFGFASLGKFEGVAFNIGVRVS
jgi:hypothetical protein